MSWRDTNVAILFFVDNKNFSDVLSKITDETRKHKYYVSTISATDQTNFSFIFSQKDDRQQRVNLEIMFFHFPG